jgi:hypothetical protein
MKGHGAAALFVVTIGVWLIAQVTVGQALQRLKVVS